MWWRRPCGRMPPRPLPWARSEVGVVDFHVAPGRWWDSELSLMQLVKSALRYQVVTGVYTYSCRLSRTRFPKMLDTPHARTGSPKVKL
jgi:hypothetical protein